MCIQAPGDCHVWGASPLQRSRFLPQWHDSNHTKEGRGHPLWRSLPILIMHDLANGRVRCGDGALL